MAVGSRLLSLFALSSAAVLICFLQATPVSALTVESHGARSFHARSHEALAKRKRSAKKSKRCKPKAAPAPAPSSAPPAYNHPAPTSSSAAPPASSPPPASNNGGHVDGGLGSGKFSLAWPNGPQHLDKWTPSLANTFYTWTPSCPSGLADGVECCIMLWNRKQADEFRKAVADKIPKCAMGPNEPEISGQANISPEEGLALWNEFIRPLKQHGTKLISPAPTSDPAGKVWLQKWFELCGGDCGVDVVALHWYDVKFEGFKDHVNDYHDTFNKPLWISEFACHNFNGGAQCSEGEIWDFAKKATAFLQGASFVEKYSPFGAMQNLQGVNPLNSLMNPDGSPNALARVYAGQ